MRSSAWILVTTVLMSAGFAMLGAQSASADPLVNDQTFARCARAAMGYSDTPYIGLSAPCLKVSFHANSVWLQNPSAMGIGVVRGSGPNYSEAYGQDSWSQRWGGGLSLEYDLGPSTGFFGLGSAKSNQFVFVDVEGSWAQIESSGEYRVGSDDVSTVAAILIQPFPTGPSSTVSGFGLSAAGASLPGRLLSESDWKSGMIGIGHVIPISAGSPTGSGLVAKAGALLEKIGFSSDGRLDLLFNGNPYSGFGYNQSIEYSSSDIYVGLEIGVDYYFQPNDDLTFFLGANLTTGYHSARGHIREQASFQTYTTDQSQHYRRNEIFIGGGLSAKAEWRPYAGWSITTGIAVDYVPDVTGYISPTEYFEEPGRFRSKDIWRVDVTMLNVNLRF